MFNFIKHDLYRYSQNISFKSFLKYYILSPGFHMTFWFRLNSQYNNILLKYILHKKAITYGIDLVAKTNIGKGLYIGHYGGIVINPKTIMGENCNISQGVTIGQVNNGLKKGTPIIGDRVYIAPGAKIIGNIQIGSDVVIGANAVVVDDIAAGVTVGGVPAKLISNNDSSAYICKMYNVHDI